MLPRRASFNDVVFAFPPARGQVGTFTSHLGVGYLRAALAESGIGSVQYLNPRPGTPGEVARDILALRPGIVGFTAYDANFSLCLSIVANIKREQPRMPIVFGGPTVTFRATELLARHEVIDLCFLGEAEDTGPRVLGTLLDGLALEDDPAGVAFRRDGQIVCAGGAPLAGGSAVSAQSSLDRVPSPYLSGMLQDGHPGLLTGRGCTRQCQYCCFTALGRNKLRLHSVERVVAELECIASHQRRTGQRYVVPVNDDAFTLLPTRAKGLCQALIDRGLKLRLSAMTRADAVDDELLALMRAAGFVSVAFGLESAVPSVLRAAGKVRPPDWPDHDLAPERHFVERVRQSVMSAKKLGLGVGVSVILGLPTETAADGEATLRFIETLPVDYYVHNFLHVFPGTPLWDTRAHYGLHCSIDATGLPRTTGYAYDVQSVRPRPKCSLESGASEIREFAAETMYDCEAPGGSAGSVSTVIIESEELEAETAAWLQTVLAVGGMVVQIYAPLKRQERDRRLQRDRSRMTEHLVPARHYIQVERKRTGAGNLRHMIASPGLDLYRRHRPRLVSFTSTEGPSPVLAWLRGAPTGCQVSEISPAVLKSPEFGSLTDRLDAQPGGAPLQEMPIPPRLRYSGRWLRESSSCRSLDRLEVDPQGNVRCCSLGDPIGKVGDTTEDLMRSFAELARAAEQRRGCRGCPLDECPRCPFPGQDDRVYCEAAPLYAKAFRTLNWIRLYSRLPSTIAGRRDATYGV